ncbi:hypothetical protein J6590_100688 [Homalodisca vitripennis]|nr:hypothetical protein J6590_100688 [Homalodisca vitripennis]
MKISCEVSKKPSCEVSKNQYEFKVSKKNRLRGIEEPSCENQQLGVTDTSITPEVRERYVRGAHGCLGEQTHIVGMYKRGNPGTL